MIVKFFGLLDLASALAVFLFKFNIPKIFVWAAVIYLGVKGLIFLKDFSSLIDLTSVVIIIFALYGHYNRLTYLVVLWLLQKGITSLV
ncbi:hypothetical protein HY643_02480 [Candidatus Woesearchaeota archaeon]|nr:hypothetical protein [Candidatus Woesearchaeota archaeon]